VNERKPSDFDTKDLTQDLSRLLKVKSKELPNVAANPELEKKIAGSSLCGVIKYLEVMLFTKYMLALCCICISNLQKSGNI
jgi:hypothetical protein